MKLPSGNAWPYAFAGLALLAGAFLRFVFEPLTGSLAGYLYFFPGVVIGATLGGAGPALIATLAGTVLGLTAIGPDGLTTRELVFALMFYLNGALIGALGAKSRAEHEEILATTQELRLREAHLKSILDTVPDAMVVIDEAGKIRSFGAAAEGMFQWKSDEIVGKHISVLMPTASVGDRDGSRVITVRAETADAIIWRETPVVSAVRKDCTTFPAELTVGEVRSLPRLFTGFIRDLTSQHQAEARLQLLQAELIHISRLSAMGEMAAALAHELNQPLSAIVNYHGGIKRTIENNRDVMAVSLLPKIDEAAHQALRAGDILHRIRDFTGGRETTREMVPLKALISEASALAFVGTDASRIKLNLQFDRTMKPILVDKIQIQQVVLNLARNAIEAMEDQDHGELTIRSRPGRKGMAEVDVCDTGSGISPEIGEGLFRPFVTTKADGMGIGLSICRTIVEAHGGKIWVETNIPKGSIFKFTLPLISGAEL